ncbi:hypothetical protein GCM10010423_19830 [Streptomyces levis]|uniref:Uncharacterized protein n=1 Tax=Streptomyces levis TaxID=285566 RepID=A0ABN3NN00_9ACTN
MNSEATITAPSPTPTPIAALRSRPALFFCGLGAGCEESGMGSGFVSFRTGGPLGEAALRSSSWFPPCAATSGTMGMGRV